MTTSSSSWEPHIPQRSCTNWYWTINYCLLMQRSVQSQSCTNNSLQFHQLFIKGIGNWLFVYIPTSMTLYIMYNYDQHSDEAVFYANCHDVTSVSCLCRTTSISQSLPTDKCTDMNVHSFHPLDRLRLSQEIRGGGTRRYDTLRIRHSLKKFGFFSISVSEFKNWCYITTPIAIIRGWPYSNQLVIKHILETWKQDEYILSNRKKQKLCTKF